MYTTILVPLDGSTRAEAILPHAEDLAKSNRAQLILLRVIDPTSAVPDLEGLSSEINAEIVQEEVNAVTTYLNSWQETLRASGIHVRILIERGSVVDAILAVARREGVDLIAMASHGRTGLARVIFGSVAEGILRHASQPVLLIRSQIEAQ